jgi:hypothetical protein
VTGTDLTKWPRLLVLGDPVTPAQASQILIRTDMWTLPGRDRGWVQAVARLAGIPLNRYGRIDEEAAQEFRAAVGGLDLSYLYNDRIVSDWLGGPHGWCDWNGQIGCANYNIGKWPWVEEVHDEWTMIATEFPFLRLRAQLVRDEGAAGIPAVEWLIRGGEAHLVESIGLLRPPETDHRYLAGQPGVTIERLREALAQTRSP